VRPFRVASSEAKASHYISKKIIYANLYNEAMGFSMNILGISGGVMPGNQDSSAALLADGRLVAAAEEERFTGIKYANGLLPVNAIRFCLRHAGFHIEDIDFVASPGETYEGYKDILKRFFEYNFGFAPQIILVDHHTAHAASAYYASGFDKALILTMDFSGDGKSTTVNTGRDGKIETVKVYRRPDSLGIFYSAVTQFLGFQKDSDEYKVMGMSAYGRPVFDFDHILEIKDVGYVFHHGFMHRFGSKSPAPSKQERLFDHFPLPVPPRIPQSPVNQVHYDVAASAQKQLEKAVLNLVRFHAEQTCMENLCLAGGVALNCLIHQKIRESGHVAKIFIPPVCSDAGLALGAAYIQAFSAGEKIQPLAHAYWGPEFSQEQIRDVLKRAGLNYIEISDPASHAAKLISQDRIVGWFQGRMEYGQRALGNRSILADPSDKAMKDRINSLVKFREEFRPFAPSVPDTEGSVYFENYRSSPFMTQTFTAKDITIQKAPAVVHEDGTSRIQSVFRETNSLFSDLITIFKKETGIPLVLNTSLNSYNDPIACEPHQALRTYFASGMDALIMGNFLLEKKINLQGHP
jgi:carbamoyltransferase